jgi:glycosyltransferase involved in cell wall biosynthesis
MTPKKICVVIPTKNEQENIIEIVNSINVFFKKTPEKIITTIIVDDSTDDTKIHIKKTTAILIRGDGDGLGSAMMKGLRHSLQFNPEIILTIDGDGQADINEIDDFLSPIENDQADLVLGSRFKNKDLIKYNYPLLNRFGTILLSAMLRSFTGLPLTDSHGGLRAMTPEVVRNLNIFGTHTYVQETIIDAAEKGFRILEIPSVWKKRNYGSSRVVSSIPKYVFYTLPILFLRSGQHIRLMYSTGLVLIATSFIFFLSIIYKAVFENVELHSRLPGFILITLLVTTGINFFFFGFILQLLKQIKQQIGSQRHKSDPDDFD